jgi:hypothetical protein
VAQLRIITCEACGNERMTRRGNTKYCRTCRLLANLKFLGDRTQKCIVCNEPFAPLQRNEDMCAACDRDPVAGNPEGHCGFCDKENARLVDEHINVCMECAKEPAKRKLLKGALQKKVNNTIDGVTEKIKVTLPPPPEQAPAPTPEPAVVI